MISLPQICMFFFFNDTATTEIYTLSLHDALPISSLVARRSSLGRAAAYAVLALGAIGAGFPFFWMLMTSLDRKSTRLNSSHANISYAVFCLKKKKQYHISTNLLNKTVMQRHATRG